MKAFTVLLFVISATAAASVSRQKRAPADCRYEVGETDCCHFRLRGTTFETPCFTGSVWNSNICGCDWSFNLVGSSCNPGQDCNAVEGEAPEAATCPSRSELAEDECCINGATYKALEDNTRYSLAGQSQKCPDGQIFDQGDCCCEGVIGDIVSGRCMYWSFDQGSYIDSFQNIPLGHSLAQFDNRDSLPNRGDYLQAFDGGSVTIDRLAGAYFGNQFSIAFFFRLDGDSAGATIFTNGNISDPDYPPSMYLVSAAGARNSLVLAGGLVTTRDINGVNQDFTDLAFDTDEWQFFSMVYTRGQLRVTLNDETTTYTDSRGQINSARCPLLFGGMTLSSGLAIDELLICQESALGAEELSGFRDQGTLPN